MTLIQEHVRAYPGPTCHRNACFPDISLQMCWHFKRYNHPKVFSHIKKYVWQFYFSSQRKVYLAKACLCMFEYANNLFTPSNERHAPWKKYDRRVNHRMLFAILKFCHGQESDVLYRYCGMDFICNSWGIRQCQFRIRIGTINHSSITWFHHGITIIPKDATSYCYEQLIADPLCCKECPWHVGFLLWQFSSLGT